MVHLVLLLLSILLAVPTLATAAEPKAAATAPQKAAPQPKRTASVGNPASSPERLLLRSGMALVMDQNGGQVIYAKNSSVPVPIASITKLMTAMVILDADLPMREAITIGAEDVDRLKNSRSRLPVGTTLTRESLLHVALISSDNRAAAALGRTFPGGMTAFVAAMNRKARALGMTRSAFVEPTGLDSRNVASAEDLARMLFAAHGYEAIRDISTTPAYTVVLPDGRGVLEYRNTNGLVRAGDHWHIGLSKTGYIREAGRCLVMQMEVEHRRLVVVLLNAEGKYTPQGDASRIRQWLEARGGKADLG